MFVPPKSHVLRNVLLGVGVAFFMLILLVLIIAHKDETPRVSKLQVAITAAMQDQLAQNKQRLYEKIHLAGEFGSAKSDVIQDLAMQWKDEHVNDDAANLAGFTVDHTLYWSTPLTSDGHTKLRDTYDCASGSPRLVESKVVETNGMTIEGTTNALINFAAQEATKAVNDALTSSPSPTPEP